MVIATVPLDENWYNNLLKKGVITRHNLNRLIVGESEFYRLSIERNKICLHKHILEYNEYISLYNKLKLYDFDLDNCVDMYYVLSHVMMLVYENEIKLVDRYGYIVEEGYYDE